MRVLTWNINGLRSVVARFGTLKVLLESAADIVCFQEIKTRRSEIERELALVEGWESFFTFSPSKPGPGYSGVATFCRTATASTPVAVEQGLTGCQLPNAAGSQATDGSKNSGHGSSSNNSGTPLLLSEELGLDMQQLQSLDSEGRALITDHGMFVLVNLYGPALTSEERIEERLPFKLRFYQVLEWRIRRWLAAGRQVLVVGDLNISPAPIDSCDPHPIPQFLLRPDRVWLNKLLGPDGPGVVDVFRLFHPTRTQAYTCWSTATGARINNYGTRIDHILAAGQLAKHAAAPIPAEVAATQPDGTGAAASSTIHSAAAASSIAGDAKTLQDPAAAVTEGCAAHVSSQSTAASLNIITGCDIDVDFEGSDHAPVWVDLAVTVQQLPAGNAKALPGSGSSMFTGKQVSLKGWLLQKQQQQPQPTQELAAQQIPQQPLQQPLVQQQQLNMQRTISLPPLTRQQSNSTSTSSSGRTAANPTKRKTLGLPQSGSCKRLAGQSSLLGFMKQPSSAAAAAGCDSQGPGSISSAATEAAAAAEGGVLSARTGSLPQQHSNSSIQHSDSSIQHIGAVARSIQQGSWANSSHQHPMQSSQQQHQQALSTLQQQALNGSAGAKSDQQAPSERQQQAKAAWQRISKVMQAPLCKGHKEVCVIRTVKKKGANFGRQFYVCARADGPPPVGRCDHFEWAGGEKKLKGSK